VADTIEAWGSVVSAAGTIGAVIVALWLQVWRTSRRRPQLSMRFDDGGDDVVTVQLDDWCERWLRVRVVNRAGREPARNATVTLVGITRRDADGDWSTLHPNPIPLRTLKWSDLMTSVIEIPSGLWHRVDIAFVRYRPDHPTEPPRISMVPWPTNDDWQGQTLKTRSRNQLPAADHEYRLYCALACDSGPTSYYQVGLRTRADGDLAELLTICGTTPLSARQLAAELGG
jgi:hypothetical protein